jgi:diguanylate cyclase (GGDEF)-like protein
MLLDLDRFKQVNDTLGHAAGDALLQQVAGRLIGVARADDGWARLGGDEFAMVQEGIAGTEGAETAARRILAALEAPFTVMGRSIDVQASIGIAVWEDPAIGQNDLLRLADDALYTAKASGRGCYRLAGAGLGPGLREHAPPFPFAGSLGEAVPA